MRTKTLLLTVAVGAVSIATSMAQPVYSQNAVGYINLTVQPGFNLIANQLVQPSTTLAALIPSPPPLTTVYKFAGGGVFINVFDPDLGGYDPNPNETFDLGGGLFIYNPTASPFGITLVGEVPQGALSNPIPAGFSLRSSKVPQAGPLQDTLGFPPAPLDTVYKFVNNPPTPATYQISVFDPDLGWDPVQPNILVGESFFIQSTAGHAWDRSFSVN